MLDAGATETGRPYFVMELVRGRPITRFCQEEKLSIPERLALFEKACQAVQHAHQKGIIHRDLKPSNILVTAEAGQPAPRVIDIGNKVGFAATAVVILALAIGFGVSAWQAAVAMGARNALRGQIAATNKARKAAETAAQAELAQATRAESLLRESKSG